MQLLPWCHCTAISCANQNQAIPSGNSRCYLRICDIMYKYNAVYLFTHVHVDNGCLCARPGFCHFVCLLQNRSEATALKLEEIAIYNPREIWLHASLWFWQVIICLTKLYLMLVVRTSSCVDSAWRNWRVFNRKATFCMLFIKLCIQHSVGMIFALR